VYIPGKEKKRSQGKERLELQVEKHMEGISIEQGGYPSLAQVFGTRGGKKKKNKKLKFHGGKSIYFARL